MVEVEEAEVQQQDQRIRNGMGGVSAVENMIYERGVWRTGKPDCLESDA